MGSSDIAADLARHLHSFHAPRVPPPCKKRNCLLRKDLRKMGRGQFAPGALQSARSIVQNAIVVRAAAIEFDPPRTRASQELE